MLLILSITVLLALVAPSFQNEAPIFDTGLATFLQETGINENTPANTVIGQLSCSDPDGDRVYYQVLRAQSVDVDFYSGNVTLVKQLDKEATCNQALDQDCGDKARGANSARFVCFDHPKVGTPVEVYLDVTITVIDFNDNSPVFVNPQEEGYTFYVREDAKANTILNGTISISDADYNKNAKLQSLSLICDENDPAPCETFSVSYRAEDLGEYVANVILNKEVDFETRTSYVGKLVAIDAPGEPVQLTSSTGIRIIVNDSQDTNPEFVNTDHTVDIYEELPVGTIINFNLSARDGDQGERRPVRLKVLEGSSGGSLFRAGTSVLVNEKSGIYSASLIVAQRIDREGFNNIYTFTAEATEIENGAETDAKTTSVFTVNVRDLNDNYPVFSQNNYFIAVPERPYQNNSLQIPNLRIEVNDADEFLNSKYELQIFSQEFSGAFTVRPSGQVFGRQFFGLTVNNFQYMDYDNPAYRRQEIQLIAVEIMENGTKKVSPSNATVYLTLEDINDHSPEFEAPTYEAPIGENAGNFTPILTVKAKDLDDGENGKITYTLQASLRHLFYINPVNGTIYLIGKLDYEVSTEYSFLVSAVDHSSKPKTDEAVVLVRVIDYNDIGPQFQQDQYTARVSESTTVFESPVQVEAIDPGSPTANITYRIVSGNTPTSSFVLDPNTGVLSLREVLNYETTPNRTGIFTLVVEATDNESPPQTASTLVTVTVLDENNHTPIFIRTQYTATVSEGVKGGTFLVKVSATDADFGSNGDVTYSIGTGGKDNIVVSPDGNVFVSNFPSFDYDEYQSLEVKIIAADGGSPRRSATATLYLSLTDANNKDPSFTQTSYSATVDESSNIGTSVLRVSATDPDSVHTLRYSIIESTITAISKAGSQVGSTYPYNYKEAFVINDISGVISVGGRLDRTYVVELYFNVMVRDVDATATPYQNDTVRVLISIEGKPETELFFNLPWTKYNPNYVLPILESARIGKEIMTLQARDPLNSKVVQTYEEVANTDPGDYFRIVTKIDSRGIIPGILVLNRKLDYESVQRSHSVVVRAIQNATAQYARRTATANITVLVQDFNDNRPEFTRSVYKFLVREGMPVNSLVGVITAIDQDSASFGPIEFILGRGLDSDDFKLRDTGISGVVQLLINKSPDFEKRQRYDLEIVAKDSSLGLGSAVRLDSTAVIEITVEDVNDNSPTFADRKRVFSVAETADPRTAVGKIVATDADFGLNGEISYSVKEDPASHTGASAVDLFSIISTQGILFTRKSLVGLSGAYNMLVVAEDAGAPSRSAAIPVTIKIQGAEDDDGRPFFLQPINDYIVRVTEHNQTKLDVQIVAIARTPNASVTYSLAKATMGYQNFRIDPNNGNLFVIADLDYEVRPEYTLLVEAKDTKNASLISSRKLHVKLIDVNDNPPSFKKSIFDACPNDFEVPTVFYVQDNTPEGVIVAQASACDPDGPGNDMMYYYLYTGNNICRRNYFGDFDVLVNGSIRTLKMVDYETRTEYLVCVEVRASPLRHRRAFGRHEMVDTARIAYIVIMVIDINDKGPVFPVDSKTAVLAVLPTENTVVQVTAIDPDGPGNNLVRYTIDNTMFYPPKSGNPTKVEVAFAINPKYGVITTNLPSYEQFARGYFLITVSAFDVNNQLFNDTMTVKVLVYQRSQLLRVVLNKLPPEGVLVAQSLMSDLDKAGAPNLDFFFRSASEHRSASYSVSSQRTDICFVLVENNKVYEAHEAITVLDSDTFRDILTSSNYSMVDRGTCYPLMSSQENVKWRDLWWVLVVIAIFIFICCLILIATVWILYNRYENYMDTQTTYLVAQ